MRYKLLYSLLLAFAVAACASAPEKEYACPDWTRKGESALSKGADVFFGVGDASNIGNVSLLRKTSDTRAINAIAQQLNVTSKSMVEDYMNSVSTEGGESSEQSVTQGIKTITEKAMAGVEIIDRCHDTEAGIHYSLARYDVERMKKIIDMENNLDPKLKEYVKDNANKFFEKMDAN